MKRQPPFSAPDPASLAARREPILEAELHLVTPMFGGGAEPAQPDADAPVRGSTIRGQLRFWWRACNAARFATVDEMFRAEAEIWGQSADAGNSRQAPSAVDLSVSILDRGRLRRCAVRQNVNGRERLNWQIGRQNQQFRALSYALWPFVQAENGRAKEPAQMLEGLKFRLSFSLAAHIPNQRLDDVQREVHTALWAWVTFGGLGARTRRGCGALYSPSIGGAADPLDSLRGSKGQYVAGGTRRLQIPSLRGATLLLGRATDPLTAWNQAIGWMQDFRQGVPFARNPGQQQGRPGRSRWPEPDSVRQLLNLPDSRHPPEHPARPYFPRADLGLPILFQQMGDRTHTLQGSVEGRTRFASPVVLKPLAAGPDRAMPMVLVFDAPHIWEMAGVTLKSGGGRPVSISSALLYDPAKSSAVSPLQNQETARDAFVTYVEGQPGITRVTL